MSLRWRMLADGNVYDDKCRFTGVGRCCDTAFVLQPLFRLSDLNGKIGGILTAGNESEPWPPA